MPILTCPTCQRPTRFTESRTTYLCPHCQGTIAGIAPPATGSDGPSEAANKQAAGQAASSKSAAQTAAKQPLSPDTTLPTPKPSFQLARPSPQPESQPKSASVPPPASPPTAISNGTEATAMSGTNSNRPANTPTQQASEATNPPSFNAPTVEVQSWLPPKLIAPHLVQRWLPPRFNPSPASDVVWGSKNNSHTVRLPDGQGGFTTVDDRVTYIWVNGERIPVTVPDRAIRWRIRFLFNLVAMLVSILILYLAYLWISS